jgi:hypothetical protein
VGVVPVTRTRTTDEAIHFSDDASVVNSFRGLRLALTNTTNYADYANITPPLTPRYCVHEGSGAELPAGRAGPLARGEAHDAETSEIQYRCSASRTGLTRCHDPWPVACRSASLPIQPSTANPPVTGTRNVDRIRGWGSNPMSTTRA